MSRRFDRFPPEVRAEVQRILDRAARRLLVERRDEDDSARTSARPDDRGVEDGTDEGAALVERE